MHVPSFWTEISNIHLYNNVSRINILSYLWSIINFINENINVWYLEKTCLLLQILLDGFIKLATQYLYNSYVFELEYLFWFWNILLLSKISEIDDIDN